MKVLHSYKAYRPDLDGGIPFVIATLTGHTKDIDNQILVARTRGFARRLSVDGVPVEAVSSFGTLFSTPLAPGFIPTLLARARSSDVVVHHAPFPLTDLVVAALPSRVALVVYWHADITGFPLLKSIVTPAILKTLRRADRIIVAHQSNIDNSALLRDFAAKCSIIPYGADIDQWASSSPEQVALTRRLRERHPRLIVAIGRLVPYKGYTTLLHALSKIDAQLIVIGEGPLRQTLSKLADDLGVTQRVTLAGRLASGAIKAHLHAARAFAFPSVTTAEAFGIVQLEAMAVGLPIVNTALASAVPHIARHEQEALTVPPGDPIALAHALQLVLDNPALAERLGRGGQVRAREEYSLDRYVARVRAVYDDALQTRARAVAL